MAEKIRLMAVNLPARALVGHSAQFLEFFAIHGILRIVTLADAIWLRNNPGEDFLPDNPGTPWGVRHPRERIAPLDPMEHLATFRPIPLLVLHAERDEVVPWATQRAFIERLREHYRLQGADPAMIEVKTWEQTGAPAEHAGFGRFAGEAKDLQTAFLRRWLVDEA